MAPFAFPPRLTITALSGFPEIRQGDDLARLATTAMRDAGCVPHDDDVLVLAQKIVSKAEGRRVRLASIGPSERAKEIAAATGKDPRYVEAVLGESHSVLRVGREVVVVEDVRGIVLANAGVDQSNVGSVEAEALLLPVNPDASARAIASRIHTEVGVRVAVIICDSIGRAWRLGTVGHAIGVAGLSALIDLRGRKDREGRSLRHSEIALGDSLAAAAALVMGEGDEGRPAALIRGVTGLRDPPALRDQGAKALQRPLNEDLFR